VACFGPLVVFVWRLVKHISICCVASLVVCPMHGVILIFARVVAKSFSTLHSSSMRWGVASVFMV